MGKVDTDARDWLTIKEVKEKLGDTAGQEMIDYLEVERPTQCRDHPDAPGIKDRLQPANPKTYEFKNSKTAVAMIFLEILS